MTNATVTDVYLERNYIQDEGAKAIATALLTNTTVTSVDLNYNGIGAEGAKAIITALGTNMTLRRFIPTLANVPNFLARNVALWKQHLWHPVHHITFPQSCHPLVVTTLLCGRACPPDCLLPVRVWCFIFSFWKRRNFLEGREDAY